MLRLSSCERNEPVSSCSFPSLQLLSRAQIVLVVTGGKIGLERSTYRKGHLVLQPPGRAIRPSSAVGVEN